MSTRGAIGFRLNKQDKVTYNHSSSYPEYLGRNVLEFIQGETLESLTTIAQSIVLVNEEEKPTAEQINECQQWANLGVGNQSVDDWYCLLRGTQGNLSVYKTGLKYMIDSSGFLINSLFCEYAYIINLNNNTLEFYTGYNKKARKSKGRYAKKGYDDNSGYYGVVLVEKFPLETVMGATSEQLTDMVTVMQSKAEKFYNRQAKKLEKKLVFI